MSFSTVSALSPLDGRYAAKLAALRPLMSEQGYMHRRVQVEVAWFVALSDCGFAEFKPLTPGALRQRFQALGLPTIPARTAALSQRPMRLASAS